MFRSLPEAKVDRYQGGIELLKPFKPGLGKKSLWLIRLGQKMYQDFVKSAVFIFTKTLHAFFYQ